ncbi:MAG: hypothetical protein ACFCD0_27455 [Gemmataceae bacterium]
MPRVCITFLLVIVGVGLFVAGLIHGTSSPLASIPNQKPELPALSPKPVQQAAMPSRWAKLGAGELLGVAFEKFRPDRFPWVQADIKQEVRYGSINYSANGQFFQAPNERLRLDLKIRTVRSLGKLTLISDGKSLAENLQFGSLAGKIKITELPQVFDRTEDLSRNATEREEMIYKNAFLGSSTLLRSLRNNLQNLARRGVRADQELLIEVKGRWIPNWKDRDHIPPHLRLEVQPRECRVYLDGKTLWPVRVEWWGNESKEQQNRILIQTEYLNPVLNKPLSASLKEKHFTIPAHWEDTETKEKEVHRIDFPTHPDSVRHR